MASTFDGDVTIRGSLVPTRISLPASSVTDATVAAGSKIGADKQVHRYVLPVAQVPGSAIVAETRDIFTARAAGTVVSIKAVVTGTIATGVDRHVYVDLHKSTGGGAFATVLSADIDLDNTSTLLVPEVGTITSASFVADDTFRLIVTVAGAAGAQAEGLLVTVHINEDPN